MTQEQKERLEDLRNNLLANINDISSDFADDHALSDSAYISDSFTEYADSATNIYYSDQYNYYVDHSDRCEVALLELMDPDSIADYIRKNGLYYLCCYAGALGQYMELEQQLTEDEEEIKKILIIDYCLNCDIYLTQEQIEEIAQNDFDRWDDYADQVNETIRED